MLENLFTSVVEHLKKINFEEIDFDKFLLPSDLPDRCIIHNIPYSSILKKISKKYNLKTKLRDIAPKMEFVLSALNSNSTEEFPIHKDFLKVRIDVKWQEVSGSTQEKLIFNIINLQYAAPEDNILILVDGPGIDESLLLLAREMSGGLYWEGMPKFKPKRICLMNVAQFINWCERAFK